jgi:hypothetical protein
VSDFYLKEGSLSAIDSFADVYVESKEYGIEVW